MARRTESTQAPRLVQLSKDVKAALQLAIAGLAPTALVDELATAAGLLEALAQFPLDAAPVVANSPRLIEMSNRALGDWQQWQSSQRRRKGSA
jgi:hypothetical protein